MSKSSKKVWTDRTNAYFIYSWSSMKIIGHSIRSQKITSPTIIMAKDCQSVFN